MLKPVQALPAGVSPLHPGLQPQAHVRRVAFLLPHLPACRVTIVLIGQRCVQWPMLYVVEYLPCVDIKPRPNCLRPAA